MSRYQQLYREKLALELCKKLGCKSVMEVPELLKITLNMGVGEGVADKKIVDNAVRIHADFWPRKRLRLWLANPLLDLKFAKACPSVREVTLRGKENVRFLRTFMCITIPRIRDFRGIHRSLMVVAILVWVFVSKSSSRKLSTIKLMRFVV